MNGSFVSLYQEDLAPANVDEGPFATLVPRASILSLLAESPHLDVLVIGGGCTGALVARDAALRGLSVLVLERGFFGDRAEPWRGSFLSAVRHDFADVMLGAPCLRGISHRVLGDLTDVTPSDSGLGVGKLKALGLRLIRRMWRAPVRGRGGSGVPDIDERVLARELILAARQEGALVLANATAAFVERVSDTDTFRIGVRDQNTGHISEVSVGAVVVNPHHGDPVVTRMGTPLTPTCVQETPIVLSVCAVIPTSVRSGEPLISLELSDGSLAVVKKTGDGVVEVSLRFSDRVPEEGNITALIKEACREGGWQLSHEISRIRTGRRFSPDVSIAEKKGLITFHERFPWEMEKVSRKIQRLLTTRFAAGSRQPRTVRELPGAERACEISAFRAVARGNGVSEATIELVVKRWRGRVRYLDRFADGLREVCPGVLKGEIALALVSDHPASFEDLMIGSLDIRALPNWRACVTAIAHVVGEGQGISVSKDDIERVIDRMSPKGQ
jgi:hypothetical protein